MKNRELPPPPDPATGVPTLPAAPPYRGLSQADGKANGPGEPKLAPPEEHGPVLAWRNPRWWKDGFRPAIAGVLTPMLVIVTVYDQGIGWTADYGWWLFLAFFSLRLATRQSQPPGSGLRRVKKRRVIGWLAWTLPHLLLRPRRRHNFADE